MPGTAALVRARNPSCCTSAFMYQWIEMLNVNTNIFVARRTRQYWNGIIHFGEGERGKDNAAAAVAMKKLLGTLLRCCRSTQHFSSQYFSLLAIPKMKPFKWLRNTPIHGRCYLFGPVSLLIQCIIFSRHLFYFSIQFRCNCLLRLYCRSFWPPEIDYWKIITVEMKCLRGE